MKKIILSLVVLAAAVVQLSASERTDLLNETFLNVNGPMEATDVINQSQLDNPSGWSFTNAYAGPQCVIIKKGGSITTPPVAALTGNAAFSFDIQMWEDPTGKTTPDWENMKPHVLSLSGKGELSTYEYDAMSSHMAADAIYDADASTRLTLTADYDIMLSNVSIFYAGNDNTGVYWQDYTKYSHESGEYFNPFDLKLTKSTTPLAYDDGLHNILVYTLDGTDPVRTSQRYEDTPIHIASSTTLKTATIFGNGYMSQDKARTYTFPTAEIPEIPANTFELTVSKPGNLKTQLLDIDADILEGLVLKGKINGSDLKYLAGGEGRTASISYLDLSELTFVYDNTEYRTIVDAPEGGMGTTYVYHYYLSEENKDERAGSSPSSVQYNCFRNNLAAAFARHKTIKTVVLPSFITSLGERIFDRCEELTSVQYPDGLTAVGDMAFYYCTKLQLYDFPTSFEEIGNAAFAGTRLGNVKFDKKVRLSAGAFEGSTIVRLEMPFPPDSIHDLTFAYCSNLEEIFIGNGLKYLGDRAFGYTPIKKAQLPETIEELAENVFYGCNFIGEIQPEDGIRYIGKVAYEITERNRQEYSVKSGTVSLAPQLFAFTSATTFNIPKSLEIIGKEAFACTKISNMPDMPSLKRIGQQAFRNCERLARITIPESVVYIDGSAFYGCNALWSVTYNAINAECCGRISPRDLERIVIGEKVRRLPMGLYTGNTNVTEVILPRSVEILDPSAFSGCLNLEYIHLSDNITTISDEAFGGCSSLRDLHWPARLKTIGSSAFSNCTSLRTISLPEGVDSVGSNAFGYCKGVENIYIASTIRNFGYGCFTFDNADTPTTITATATSPQNYEWNWHYVGPATIKVPAASVAAYKADVSWNGSDNGKTNQIVALEGISASYENTETSFSAGIDNDTDLGDTVIGDVYVTVGEEDGFDESDGSIVLNSIMNEEFVEAVGGMAPGESDIANRFNGLVVKVPAGHGSVTVSCMTTGTKRISVKIGEEKPMYYIKNSKGEISVDYNVAADTYVYIYASEAADVQQTVRRLRTPDSVTANCVRIYSIGVNPGNSGIEGIETGKQEESPIAEYFRIDGSKVDSPDTPGIYIGRRADGSAVKILIRN